MAVITACAVNIKPSKAANEPTATPTILDGATPEYTGQRQKIVTDLPDGMRYFITTEYIDPATIDAGKIVPAKYTALDYLQSTGTQWLDTAVPAEPGLSSVIKFEILDEPTDNGILGARGHSANGERIYLLQLIDNGFACGYGQYYPRGTVNTDTVYTVETTLAVGNQTLIVNGDTLYTNTDNSTITNGLNLYMFAANYDNEAMYFAPRTRMYAVRIAKDNSLLRDFVPVRRDTDQKLGMYDLCTGEMYMNNASGDDFIAGEAVNTAIKDWQWLDSVDDPANQKVLEYDQTYYVYYYTPNTDTTTVTPLAVKEFTVACNTHVYGEWHTTTPATCTTDGERERVCQGCGHVDSEVVPATGHKYSSTFDQTTGKTVFTCTVCQHSYDYDCTDREHGHEFIDSVIAPDCTEIGSTKHTCTNCYYSYEDNFVPALGHSYGAWVTTEPATTDHTGVQQRVCERCKAVQERTLPALAGTTTNDGGKDNTAPLLWGIIIGVIAVLAGCGGLAWLLLAVFKPRRQKQEKVAAA